MPWFHADKREVEGRDHASASEVLAHFRDERVYLSRLALLITGDESAAEQSVVNACEITVQGHSPFRDWLTEWAKSATITSAISKSADAIRSCEPEYKGLRCSHSEHLALGNNAECDERLSLVLSADPRVVIAELDPLVRAVLVLRVAIRSSVQDCASRLNISRAAILAANCRAMTWLHNLQLRRTSAAQHPSSAETRSEADPSRPWPTSASPQMECSEAGSGDGYKFRRNS
jgi:hypothetical protein